MGVGQRLDLRQSQQLVMTPQLQQAIKMLQMSNLELAVFIDSELQRNPLLDRADEAGGDAPAPAPEADAAPRQADEELARERLDRASEVFDTGSENLEAEASYADRQAEAGVTDAALVDAPGSFAAQEGSAWADVGRGGSSKFDDLDQTLEGRAAAETTLREHLLRQLGQSVASAAVRLIASYLIEQLDECGYLTGELGEIAERLGAAPEDAAAALTLLQSLDPAGVGARGLAECLRLQLIDRDRCDPAMQALLDNLELLAAAKYPKLRSLCGVDDEDLRDMIRDLRALDPKPGLRFQSDVVQTVLPDVFVSERRTGGWQVELNTDTLPKVLVNKSYAAEVLSGGASGSRDKAVREYLAECQQNASWLVKSIDQRAKTILRVASEIVRQQDGFFAYGVSGLRPLNLKQIADAIEMHESTVSRVTSNKFIGTPRGIFEMKYFFTPAISSTNGEDSYSAETIRQRIKTLIDCEAPDAILSDDRIVTILRTSGVDIARRTVTKYREALGIPSSIKRRRDKAAMALL